MISFWHSFWALPIIGITIIIILAIMIYFIPSYIAFVRRKKQLAAIFVINLFLGCTALGWVGALVWAMLKENSDGNQ